MREANITYRGKPEQTKDLRSKLAELRGTEWIEGGKGEMVEQEKTERDLRVIAFANDAVAKFVAVHGGVFESSSPEKISFLSEEDYANRYQDDSSGKIYFGSQHIVLSRMSTVYREEFCPDWEKKELDDEAVERFAEEDPAVWKAYLELSRAQLAKSPIKVAVDKGIKRFRAVLRKERQERNKIMEDAFYFHTLVHELLHKAGALVIGKDEQGDPIVRRSGYDVHNDDRTYFTSLNEAVVEEMAREAIRESREDRGDEMGACDSWLMSEMGFYDRDRDLLSEVINIIAEAKGIVRDESWALIKREYFRGGMMHLRAIEKIVGPGTLRKYAKVRPEALAQDPEHFDAISQCLSGISQKEYDDYSGELRYI